MATSKAKQGAKSKGNGKNNAAAAQQGIKGWHYELLRYPLITEKTSLIGASGSRLAFRVPRTATKAELREAVENLFKVNVVGINTVNVLGKVKRGTHGAGRRANFKKAYITLKEGQTISVVEGL